MYNLTGSSQFKHVYKETHTSIANGTSYVCGTVVTNFQIKSISLMRKKCRELVDLLLSLK